jgi:hypothetical protein
LIHSVDSFPSRKNGPVAQLGARFHGMEEVVGSIPTRSTKSLNQLDGASADRSNFCVAVCVVTRRSCAQSEGFHRCPLRFHPHVAVALQHATAHVTSDCHDGRIRYPTLGKLGNRAMPKIVESKSHQPRFLCQGSPSRSPALYGLVGIERSQFIADDLLAAKGKFGVKAANM